MCNIYKLVTFYLAMLQYQVSCVMVQMQFVQPQQNNFLGFYQVPIDQQVLKEIQIVTRPLNIICHYSDIKK